MCTGSRNVISSIATVTASPGRVTHGRQACRRVDEAHHDAAVHGAGDVDVCRFHQLGQLDPRLGDGLRGEPVLGHERHRTPGLPGRRASTGSIAECGASSSPWCSRSPFRSVRAKTPRWSRPPRRVPRRAPASRRPRSRRRQRSRRPPPGDPRRHAGGVRRGRGRTRASCRAVGASGRRGHGRRSSEDRRGEAVVIAFAAPGGDPFRRARGFVVWRREPGDDPPWRAVYGLAHGKRDGVLSISADATDLTDDGSDDALIREETGGSGTCATYRVIDLAAGLAIWKRAVCDAEIQPSPDPIGLYEVTRIYDPGDPHCCPSAIRGAGPGMGRRPLRDGLRGGHPALVAGTDGETLPGMTWLSVPDVAREANVDETSSDASSTWGAVGEDEGLLGDRDVRRVRLLHSWERAGLRADLVVRTVETGSSRSIPRHADDGRCGVRRPDLRRAQRRRERPAVPRELPARGHGVRGTGRGGSGSWGRRAGDRAVSDVHRLRRERGGHAPPVPRTCGLPPSLGAGRGRVRVRDRGTTPQCRHGRAPPLEFGSDVGERIIAAVEAAIVAIYRRHREYDWTSIPRTMPRSHSTSPACTPAFRDLPRSASSTSPGTRCSPNDMGRARRPRRGGARRARRGDLGPTSWTTDPMVR